MFGNIPYITRVVNTRPSQGRIVRIDLRDDRAKWLSSCCFAYNQARSFGDTSSLPKEVNYLPNGYL